MPKCLIVYFSQAGSTAKVAEAIARGLRGQSYDVDLHNLKDGPPPPATGYELLGIGSPVYYYRQPFNVMDHAGSLPNLEGVPVFTFNTHGTYRFDAAEKLTSTLTTKVARLVGHFACQGTGTFLPYARLGYVFSPDHPTVTDLGKAEAFGREVAAQSRDKSFYVQDREQPAPPIYRLERNLSNRWLAKHLYSRFFSLNRRLCNKCGLCVKVCPIASLKKGKRGLPVWQRDCLLCFTCEARCPRDAIRSPLTWPVFGPFLAYNVRKASRDDSLGFVKVRHKRGRTERL